MDHLSDFLDTLGEKGHQITASLPDSVPSSKQGTVAQDLTGMIKLWSQRTENQSQS
jgi:hypothetical protein